jgi:S-adenosylmethionine:tRNA ribosyltransferase-isomerase
MLKSDFSFELPEELIAQSPLPNRADSRLMRLDKNTGEIAHTHFSNISDFIQKGDCLVINDTKVIPARLWGERANTGGKVELLLLKKIDDNTWETLVKPGRKALPGDKLTFGQGLLSAEIMDTTKGGNRLVRFTYDGIFEEVLDKIGEMPLPHYITEKLEDKDRYQTVYATHEGSVAAPTAGLHFTPEILSALEQKGVSIVRVTLHVGLGTFRPVKAENIQDHDMHSEWYSVLPDAAAKMNAARQNGGKIIAVGTTSCRTLESAADENGFIQHGQGDTDIFIYPGYQFKGIDALITNFHLPESTLIMLVSAMAGRENVLRAYTEAVEERYRFFSFGDAMLIG